MKTIVTVLLIAIFNLSYAQQSNTKQDLKTAELTGNVKSVLEKTVTLLSDGGRYDVRHIYTEYNTQGNQVLYKFITDVKKNKFSHNIRIFDGAQNLIEVNMHQDSVLIEKRQYQYDSQNRLIKESMFRGNGHLYQKYLHYYDKSGHLTETQLWSPDTYFVLKQLYKYDTNGNQLSLKTYDANNILQFEYNFQYDKKNNKTGQVYKKANSPIVKKTKNTYNENNKLIKSLVFDNDIIADEANYTFIQNTGTTETISIYPKNHTKYITRYNEKGLLVETLDYKKKDVLTVRQTYWYEYDPTGNWTKRFNSYNGESPSLTEREIEYYKKSAK